MPSVSKSQQRLMGMAYAYKIGELGISDLNKSLQDKIKSLSNSMSEEDLKDFAKTKHKDLPKKVNETKHVLLFEEFINNMV